MKFIRVFKIKFFPVTEHKICTRFLVQHFPLRGHEICYNFLIKLFPLCGLAKLSYSTMLNFPLGRHETF